MSGEALHSTQRSAADAIAIEDWERGIACSVPRRRPEQLAQLQFHCGKPPPAAAPSTRTRIRQGHRMCAPRAEHGRRVRSAVGHVGRDLEAEAPFNRGRSLPSHGHAPVVLACRASMSTPTVCCNPLGFQPNLRARAIAHNAAVQPPQRFARPTLFPDASPRRSAGASKTAPDPPGSTAHRPGGRGAGPNPRAGHGLRRPT